MARAYTLEEIAQMPGITESVHFCAGNGQQILTLAQAQQQRKAEITT